MRTYITIEGDMVDLICHRIYGDETGYVEQVLRANPGLADGGLKLPAGVSVALPDNSVNSELPAISLWS